MLQLLTHIMEVQHFTSGTTIFHQGEPGDKLYIILEGLVKMNRFSETVATYKAKSPRQPRCSKSRALSWGLAMPFASSRARVKNRKAQCSPLRAPPPTHTYPPLLRAAHSLCHSPPSSPALMASP